MDRRPPRKKVILLFSLAVILWVTEEALASSPHFDYTIHSHHLVIQIDPFRHLLKAEDRLQINMKGGRSQTLSLLLNPRLKITRIVDQRTGAPLHWSAATFSTHANQLDISVQEAEDPLIFWISYEGPIYDPIAKEKELQFVRGDKTSGLE